MPTLAGPVIVTGATGLVGRALAPLVPGFHALRLSPPDWRERIAAAPLRGATIFHLAARVHRPGDADEQAYARDNAEKTEVLARAAATAGARALVFTSSVKVNGEETTSQPFRAGDMPRPEDAYGRSKWAAEQALTRVARETGLAVQVVRPPLVYGARARGNLEALLRLCDGPLPLPFGALRNRRSFLAADDLAVLLVRLGEAATPGVAGTWMAAHPQPTSTRELVAALRRAFGRAPRLLPVPRAALELAGTIAGRSAQVRRLTRSLEVDAAETCAAFAWTPATTLEQVCAAMVASFRRGEP